MHTAKASAAGSATSGSDSMPLSSSMCEILHGLCRPCQVVIGTPGRVRALLAAKALPTSHMRVVILDEADQLMQPVFQEDMQDILSVLPASKQVLRCPLGPKASKDSWMFIARSDSACHMLCELLLAASRWFGMLPALMHCFCTCYAGFLHCCHHAAESLQRAHRARCTVQMLAFSATYSEAALRSMQAYMPRAQHIILTPDSTSLLGVKQFYVIVPGGLCALCPSEACTDQVSAQGCSYGQLCGCLQDSDDLPVLHCRRVLIKPAAPHIPAVRQPSDSPERDDVSWPAATGARALAHLPHASPAEGWVLLVWVDPLTLQLHRHREPRPATGGPAGAAERSQLPPGCGVLQPPALGGGAGRCSVRGRLPCSVCGRRA